MKRRVAWFLFVALLTVGAAGAEKRKIVPVPAWNAFEGTRWGELEIGRTTRAQLDQEYSSSETALPGVMEGNTSNRTNTELFLVFDGPGPEARLAWIALCYDGDRGAPAPLEFETRYGPRMSGGYPRERRADWRLRVAAERGVAAVLERGERRERIAALLFARPADLTALAERLSERETGVDLPLGPADRAPLLVQIGEVDVDVDVDRDIRVDRRDLRRELERSAESQARLQSGLRVAYGSGGRLAVAVAVEPRRRREEEQIRIMARATLDGEGPYGIASARSGDYTKDLAAGSSQSRIEREARSLVGQAVGSVAGSAQSQLQERRRKALLEARRQARLFLVASLTAP